jgi:type VI secretion system secreted protein Hcp
MPADAYLKLTLNTAGQLKGESKQKNHVDEIDITDWNMGESNTGAATGLSGQGTGRVNFQDFSFTSLVNSASCGIMQGCATGDPVTEAILSCAKPGGTQGDYLKFTLTDGLISHYSLSGRTDQTPSETYTVNFSTIKMEYFKQDAKGALSAAGLGQFDLRQVATS